jgi:hypothetical protein
MADNAVRLAQAVSQRLGFGEIEGLFSSAAHHVRDGADRRLRKLAVATFFMHLAPTETVTSWTLWRWRAAVCSK